MTTGYSFRAACYPTGDLAAADMCRSAYPQSAVDATGPYTLSCSASSATGLTLSLSRPSALSQSLALAPSFADCDPSDVGNLSLDGGSAAASFSYAFCLVVGCYIVAEGCGQLLSLIHSRR